MPLQLTTGTDVAYSPQRMTFIFLVLITACNCVVLSFMSLLAVGAGPAEGVYFVRLVGYSWIAFCTLVALILCLRGHRLSAVGIVFLTLPAGWGAAVAGLLAISAVDRLKPNSPQFNAACQGAGPQYIQRPAARVESIAYDWARETSPPRFNYFEIDRWNNVSALRGGITRFPSAIKFVEGRCCQFEGRIANDKSPFTRRSSTGAHAGATELTADALVTYQVTYADAGTAHGRLETVQLVVTDRRDAKVLARLRYVLNQRDGRGCGAVVDGIMDEQLFVRRAVGLN